MKESEEKEVHTKIHKIVGKYNLETEWGKIVIILDAIPNYAGGKGCPDEIVTMKVKFALWGTDIELSAPILIEAEKAGYSAALLDLDKFCERSVSGEQKSYLDIPMIIIGGTSYKKLRSIERQLRTRFNMTQVPKRVIT
jgi:hypothetical protein